MLESDELARLYDLEYDGWDEDSAFWQSFAARTGGPIAEFGCGSARALAPLAERGYAVIGVDSSQAMLNRAAERFQAYGIDEDSMFEVAGNVAHRVHALATDIGADLIVVGTHGKHGLQLLTGSTANAVLHGARCDVLAVRVRSSHSE